MSSQRSLLSHSVFLIPWGISYHAFSMSFSLSLFSSAGLLPDCLPSPALEYSSSTSYASSSSTTSAWGTDKGSENDTSKRVETMC
ncbi:hypothetical protein ACFXTN_021237 [Malus domestica]